MTKKVEDIDEKVNRLEKRIEELEKRDNVCVLPKKNQENEESFLSIAKTLCIGFSVLGLGALVLLHLFFFVIASSIMLDFSVDRYGDFLMDSIRKFYQSLGIL